MNPSRVFVGLFDGLASLRLEAGQVGLRRAGQRRRRRGPLDRRGRRWPAVAGDGGRRSAARGLLAGGAGGAAAACRSIPGSSASARRTACRRPASTCRGPPASRTSSSTDDIFRFDRPTGRFTPDTTFKVVASIPSARAPTAYLAGGRRRQRLGQLRPGIGGREAAAGRVLQGGEAAVPAFRRVPDGLDLPRRRRRRLVRRPRRPDSLRSRASTRTTRPTSPRSSAAWSSTTAASDLQRRPGGGRRRRPAASTGTTRSASSSRRRASTTSRPTSSSTMLEGLDAGLVGLDEGEQPGLHEPGVRRLPLPRARPERLRAGQRRGGVRLHDPAAVVPHVVGLRAVSRLLAAGVFVVDRVQRRRVIGKERERVAVSGRRSCAPTPPRRWRGSSASARRTSSC